MFQWFCSLSYVERDLLLLLVVVFVVMGFAYVASLHVRAR